MKLIIKKDMPNKNEDVQDKHNLIKKQASQVISLLNKGTKQIKMLIV